MLSALSVSHCSCVPWSRPLLSPPQHVPSQVPLGLAGCFPGLRALDLAGNDLADRPAATSALQGLGALSHLSLGANPLVLLPDHRRAVLAALPGLEVRPPPPAGRVWGGGFHRYCRWGRQQDALLGSLHNHYYYYYLPLFSCRFLTTSPTTPTGRRPIKGTDACSSASPWPSQACLGKDEAKERVLEKGSALADSLREPAQATPRRRP